MTTTLTTINLVERTCADLARDGQPITFTAVATRAGLGRTTLYRDPTLRALVENNRHQSAHAATIAGLTDQINTLKTALDAIATRVRRHEEQLRHLHTHHG